MLASEDLEKFVDDYGDHAYSFALSLCGNETDARELVQEAFVRVFENASRFDGTRALDGWYMTVLKNLYLDSLRRSERKLGVSLDAVIDGDGSTVADAMTDPREEGMLDRLERMENAASVRKALSALTPDARAILTLVDVQGIGYEKAAKVLDCPLGTIRSRVSRARDALRAKLLETEVTA